MALKLHGHRVARRPSATSVAYCGLNQSRPLQPRKGRCSVYGTDYGTPQFSRFLETLSRRTQRLRTTISNGRAQIGAPVSGGKSESWAAAGDRELEIRGQNRPGISLLWNRARGSHSRRKPRIDEGGSKVRPEQKNPARFLCSMVDPSLRSRPHSQELVVG